MSEHGLAKFECGDGWKEIILDAVEKIRAVAPDVQFLQIKEKFGGLRIYARATNYSKVYETATEEQASAMLDEMLAIQNDKLKTKQSYAKKFKKVIPAVKVARFYQIENKIDAIISYDLAAVIPLIAAGS